MPRITLQDPFGTAYAITTRQEATLKAWFDEILPVSYCEGRPGKDDFEFLWPRIYVTPMWSQVSANPDPDWLTDSRVLGRMHEFPARDGEEGLKVLADIRRQLVQELRGK